MKDEILITGLFLFHNFRRQALQVGDGESKEAEIFY